MCLFWAIHVTVCSPYHPTATKGQEADELETISSEISLKLGHEKTVVNLPGLCSTLLIFAETSSSRLLKSQPWLSKVVWHFGSREIHAF